VRPAILLDTCAVIWIANDDKIDEPAVEALDRATDRGEGVYV
jgi:PIN domain nuclease of toxin-antitoxin system